MVDKARYVRAIRTASQVSFVNALAAIRQTTSDLTPIAPRRRRRRREFHRHRLLPLCPDPKYKLR